MTCEATNVELDDMRRGLEQLREQTRSLQLDRDQLRTSMEKLEKSRRELDDTRASLQQARELIDAMQSSKLWQLKESWSRLKRVIGSAGSK